MIKLNNKTAIITGGAGALGGSLAAHLASKGVKVAILGRTGKTVHNKVKHLQENGGEALALVADALDKTSLENARNLILSQWGQIDILINAAGGNMGAATIMPDQSFFDMDTDAFEKVVQLNLSSAVLCCQVFGWAMANSGKGNILNISSMAAQLPLTRVIGYSAAKAALDNFTKWLAVEMATKYGEKLRVNAIAPGFFIGEQNKKLLLNDDGSLTARAKTIIDQTPMRRFGRAEELNGVVEYLVSEAASFVTGVVIPVDGGFSAFSGV